MRDEERGWRGVGPPPRAHRAHRAHHLTSDRDKMGSEAVDSDGSISWEDFIGTTTDLVPQLLGMFDEIARGKGEQQRQQQQHVFVPAELQKRLSLVQKRRSRASALYDMAPAPADDDAGYRLDELDAERTSAPTILVEEKLSPRLARRVESSPTPLRYGGLRCRTQQTSSRPVSSSSIGSSTSSSGCSNQGTATGAANPYLASVESLADTCASSQGSGDSGVVVTVSESGGGGSGGGGGCSKIRLSEVERATAARRFDERRPRFCDPQRSPVERVLLEIVGTESDYVEDLRQVVQGYLTVWRDDSASLIQDSQLNGLFSNIEDIYEFNRNFSSALDSSGLDPIVVANTFMEHNTGFKVYTEYCTNYPRTVSILTDLMGQDEIARAFRERQTTLGHDLPLGSFLLKPVQRILKYRLLLASLLKEFEAARTEVSGTERAAIEGALEAMTEIARHINEMKRKHEHAVRVQEIQSLLYGWLGPDLTTIGELIAEGSFRMRGAKAPRHAFLFDRMLLLAKKREDGVLVYKAHILCSNLTLMESIPGEPLTFNVIAFDNSQIQYKLQAQNLEQKREWTLQIKRVILENYNAVIPSHARQLVLQIGQNKCEDDAASEKEYKKSSDHFDRKISSERRRSETGLRQKLKKGRKSDVSISTVSTENSPMCTRKNQSAESISQFGSRDENLSRSSEIRGSTKIKDRFTSWRRKSEPGFQSYISLNPSDNEENTIEAASVNVAATRELSHNCSETQTRSEDTNESGSQFMSMSKTKENCVGGLRKELKTEQRAEEIVGNIIVQSQEFQKRLDSQHQQRNYSCLHNNILKNGLQRFGKDPPVDSSEEEDTDVEEKSNSSSSKSRSRFSHREQCFVRAANAYQQRSFRSQYDSFRNIDAEEDPTFLRQNSSPANLRSSIKGSNHERRSPSEIFKKPSFVTESKLIKTALRIREDGDSTSDHEEQEESIYETPAITGKTENNDNVKGTSGNYDNLQRVWEGSLEAEDNDTEDCPSKAAVWLTKLCEGLPDQPQKCGSLPRSFQMMNTMDLNHVSKSRFLQRDGKSMTERPFTIASDKPAEINLEDMERYASNCQGSARIAKFPTASSSSTSSSNFFCSMDDSSFTDTDFISRSTSLSTSTHVHPDHKIYRANGSSHKELSSVSSLRSVLSKAGSRLQGLRSSQSTETLECADDSERTRYFRSFSKRSKNKKASLKDVASSDADEVVGCVATGMNGSTVRIELPYHKQGSPSLGARIAQADYADPAILFSESRRLLSSAELSIRRSSHQEDEVNIDEVFETVGESVECVEGDSFYERSFETIENYMEGESEEAFRDSAIFSDIDEYNFKSTDIAITSKKIAPPVPAKTKIKRRIAVTGEKPAVTQKPAHLKLRAKIVKCRGPRVDPVKVPTTMSKESQPDDGSGKDDDVSSGQSQVGWVKKIVGQLQAQVDA